MIKFDQVLWAEFKTFVDARSLIIQFRENSEFYFLKSADNWFGLECNLHKTDDASDVAVFEASYKTAGNKQIVNINSPFASKVYGAKKLYKRVHGGNQACSNGSNDILYTITYPWVKVTGVEIVGGEIGDTVSFYILDKAVSPIYGVANAVLNQFGYDVNVAKDFYPYKSEFDADAYENLQLKMSYTSISEKTIRFNFIMNEVKS